MTTYDKPKRKNTPNPSPSIPSILSSLIAGLFRYGLVVPVRWGWRQLGHLLSGIWNLTKGIMGWFGHQIAAVFKGGWWLISTILRKTVFAPFIMVGRLLGFVPNAIPDGLTDRETEVYQRIGRQYRRRKRWYLHVMIFLISMVMIWVSYLLYYPFYASASTAITLTLVWLMVLGTHRLWMNLGKSEDHEIGEALQHLRQTQQTVYYEETYEERSSRLEDNATEDNAWDDEYMYQTMKAKRHND